jgi:hypothetical protein
MDLWNLLTFYRVKTSQHLYRKQLLEPGAKDCGFWELSARYSVKDFGIGQGFKQKHLQ